MKSYGTYFKNKYAICMYGILFISAILPAILAVKNIKISPDSMMYSLVSQEIISGNGISLPMIFDMQDNHVFINGTIPFVLEPPLFPILLALLGGITPQSFLAAQILNVISHAVTSIFTFLLIKKIYNNNGMALLTGILVSISLPLLWNTHRILSEPLFIALTVAVIYFLTLARDSDRRRFNRNLFIASICTCAGILLRSAGAGLIPVFLWGTFILVKNKNIKIKHVSNIITTMLPFITAGAVFIRAYIMSGSIHGWIPSSPDRSYFDAFSVTIRMIFGQFDIGESHIILIAIFMVLFALYIIINADVRRELLKYIHSGLDLIIFFIISYTALIMYGMAKSQTVIEVRYMSPLAPFIFILCVLIIAAVWKNIRLKGFSKLSLCGLILSLGIITFGNFYKTYVNSSALFSKDAGHYRILNSPTYQWIKENYGENVIITSNRPYHLSFFGGYSTIRLPHKRFEKNTPIPDNMEFFLPNRMANLRSQVLALFDQADEQYEGKYVAGLFNKREDDDNFVLMREFSDGVVYQLKE